MSGRGSRGHGFHRARPVGIRGLRQQVKTVKRELHDTNTGRWSKKGSVIALPPWEQYAKMFRTVRLQNATGDSSGTVFLTEVS